MQGSAVPSEADGSCISENNDEISPEILYRNEKENKQDCGLVRNITGYIEAARLGANISSAFYSSGCFSASAGSNSGADKNDSWQTYRISFNASNVVTTSTEVRPTNISAIPLIVAL